MHFRRGCVMASRVSASAFRGCGHDRFPVDLHRGMGYILSYGVVRRVSGQNEPLLPILTDEQVRRWKALTCESAKFAMAR